ncbi:MAG: VCBS repeat-containing protein, partial [Myxococcota bacterium]|nr:VCBS repeat-containing protein [Myxococcota bacterium]
RRTWTATIAITMAGRNADGAVLSFRGTAQTTWRWTAASDAPAWHLAEFMLESTELTTSTDLLFEDGLAELLPDPGPLARARQSRHELRIVEHLADPTIHPGLELESFDRHPGVAVGDVNGDGHDDILATQRWGLPLLLVRQPDGTFRDEAAARGIRTIDHCSAALFVDIDNDGDSDLLIGRTLAPSVLYENEGGTLRDVSTRIEGGAPMLVSHLAAGDLDGDGLVDVHVSQYAASRVEKTWEWHSQERRSGPYLTGLVSDEDGAEIARRVAQGDYEHFLSRPGPRNVVLQNLGGGRLSPVSSPGVDALRPYRNTYATVLSDLDGDGDLDAYLANDFSPNILARNDGDWTFVDVTPRSGTADFGFGMGAGAGDVDGDGRMDLLVSNMSSKAGRRITTALGDIDPRIPKAAAGNSLFRNEGDLVFRRTSGTTPPHQVVASAGWAWAGDLADLDMDGRNDMFVLSGYYTAPWQVAREHDC